MSENKVEIFVGQIWADVDPRQERFVVVTAIMGALDVQIQRVERSPAGHWMKAKGSSARWAKRSRFNGKRGGYIVVTGNADLFPEENGHACH